MQTQAAQQSANLARQNLLAQSGGTDVMGAATQRAAASPYDLSAGVKQGLQPNALQMPSLSNPTASPLSTAQAANPADIVGRSIRPDQNFIQNLGNIGSFQDVQDYAAQHPYATSAAVGLGGLGAGQQYAQQATNPYAMQAYMSPYIENAMAPQLREAARASAIQGQQNQAAAVQQGAFGGSRSAIVEAERQRNLAQQQGDIYGRGMQTAFEQARQAQQFGADLGLRGYGMAGQMAGTLGQLGQTQFGQQQAAIQAQAAAGAQQQAQEQQGLSQAYQDFLSQRGYPQQQLSFMSDILRGVPLGQQTQVQYQAPPPLTSQLAQLGLGAYGVSQMMKKEGGIIKMAEGGIAEAAPQGSVPNTMSIDKLRSVLGDMSEEQLDQVAQGAADATTLALVQEQKSLNARMRNANILAESIPQTTIKEEIVAADNAADSGIAAAPLPAAMFADTAVGEAPEEQPAMRGGGIVAFAKGKEVKAAEPAPVDYVSQLAAMDPAKAFATPEERKANVREGIAFMDELMGPDKTIEMAEKIAKASEISPKAESQAKAAAAQIRGGR